MWESGEVLEVGVFFLACVCHEVNQNSFGKPLSFPHPSVRHTCVFSYCMSATIMFLIHFYFRMWNSSFLGGGEGCGGGGIKESLKWPSTIILPCSSWNLYLRVWSSILSCLASEEVNPHILDTLGMRKILMF